MKTWLSRFPAQDSAFIPLCLQQSRGWLVSRGFRTPPMPPPRPESGSSQFRPHPAWWVTSCPMGPCTFWNAPWTHSCLQTFPAAWFFHKDRLPLSSSLERKFHPSSNIEVSENYPGAVKRIFLYVMLSASFIGSFATNVMTISFVLQTPDLLPLLQETSVSLKTTLPVYGTEGAGMYQMCVHVFPMFIYIVTMS